MYVYIYLFIFFILLKVIYVKINHMFVYTILPILFHFIFSILQTIPFHSIPLFSIIFFNFPNPYTISLNLNHLYHLNICKVKPFFKLFFKPFSKLFSNHLEWSKMTKMISLNGGSFMINTM